MTDKWRTVRVFISSTFRDMHAERDHLVKFVFPQLRKLCESRGVTFTDVDLRWGVTDEQKAEGKVLPICLQEIKTCRPFFIGLLGERYGWVPQEIPRELIDQETWLAKHLEKSVTELEFLHGVLNNPAMANRSCFYFRDPAYVDSPAAGNRDDFIETDPAKRAKLAALKDRIRTSGLAFREGYPDPQTLGEWVLEDLTTAINQEFPPGTEPSPLEREAMDHEAFAVSRAGVYIGRKEYFDRLDAHTAGDGPPLVVLGESGSGKSALLANWVLKYRSGHPNELLLMHFIGSSPYSADWAAMLRRIMGEFKQRFGIEGEIPDKPDALRAAFANWLHMAAAKGRVVLILDALNQLEDRDGAPDLVWLPPVIPDNVRLVLSTLPGRPLDDLKKRGWPTLKVEPLSLDERKEVIRQVLSRYAKSLSTVRTDRIAEASQSANPLYLRVLLDELRLMSKHERLDESIAHYLEAQTPYDLYEKVIVRWESDYEGDTDLVGDSLSLLWAARRGLSEAELLDALGGGGRPLPRAAWSPLYLAMSDALISRGGLLTFAHDFLRQAACDAYLPTRLHQQKAHLRLADYFERLDLSPRRIDELPWQLAEAAAWPTLYTLLSDATFVKAAWEQDPSEVKAYWARIEASSALRMVDAYCAQIEHPESQPDKGFLRLLGYLLGYMGHPKEEFRLCSALVEYFKVAGDLNSLQACIGNKALILRKRGDLDGAMALMKEEERICRQLGELDGLSSSLGNQALILYDRGDLDGAMALHKEEERICRQLGNLGGLQRSLGNQAVILHNRGNLDGAMALHKEKERICRQLGELDGLQSSLGNQSVILMARGDSDGAMALLREVERICRQLGNLDGLSRALGNQGLILKDRGDLDPAMELHKEVERIFRKLGNLHGLQTSLGNQALILRERGDLDGAMALHKEEERICRQMGNLHGLSTALGNQALILRDRGDLDGAMALLREVERICRQMGNLDRLQATLGHQSVILHTRGDLDGATALMKGQERICRQLGNFEGLATSLSSQSLILLQEQRVREALKLAEEAHKMASDHGYSALAAGIARILNHLRSATD